MPNGQDAIFESLKRLREQFERQVTMVAMTASFVKEDHLEKQVQQMINFVVAPVAFVLGAVLMYWWTGH